MATELTRDGMIKLLMENDLAVARALLVINANQTFDEQAEENTKYNNGKGFRPVHAKIGTSMANFFSTRSYLTPKQVAYWRKADKNGCPRIGLYWRQLVIAAKARQMAAQVTSTMTSTTQEKVSV